MVGKTSLILHVPQTAGPTFILGLSIQNAEGRDGLSLDIHPNARLVVCNSNQINR